MCLSSPLLWKMVAQHKVHMPCWRLLSRWQSLLWHGADKRCFRSLAGQTCSSHPAYAGLALDALPLQD